jgi:glycerate kinase
MKIIIAPDSFKGSLSNFEAADAIGRGWSAVRPDDEISLAPLADGGEGTLETITAQVPGSVMVHEEVTFYKNLKRRAYWSLLPDGTAIVELAIACGITHMPGLDAMNSHTYALGELLKSAIKHPRVRKIITCLGGSASTDAGVGALIALGFNFYQADGSLVPLGGRHLKEITSFDQDNSFQLPVGGITCLVDVTNTLYGESGAAVIFGPQKGATPSDIVDLDSGLENLLAISGGKDFDGAGAAGGCAFGLKTFLNANIALGSISISELIGLEAAIASCDYVVSGEGRFDKQSLEGKVVGNLVTIARKNHKEVLLCVGSSSVDFKDYGLSGVQLLDLAESHADAMANASTLLEKAGGLLAQQVNNEQSDC